MTDHINWELILKYLENGLTDKQMNEFDHSAANKKLIEQLKNIWATEETSLPEPDIDTALERVKAAAGIKDSLTVRDNRFKLFSPKSLSGLKVFGYKFLRAAAVLIFLSLTSYVIYQILSPLPIEFKEVTVEYAENKKVELPDGSKLILDAGTSLSYPENFNKEHRQVYLNGEAYFRVTSDPQNPFIINSNNAVITVLGTRFNVRSWENYKKVVVAVAEGKVSLKSQKNATKRSEVIIPGGMMSEIGMDGIPSTPVASNIKNHICWLERKMHFENTPLKEVLGQLERWYDVEFHLQDTIYASYQVTIFIANGPIENNLEVIALMNNLKYEKQGKKIRLYAQQ